MTQPRTPETREGLWRTYGERSLYQSKWIDLNLIDVQPPEGKRFEHHAVRMRPVAVVALVRDAQVLLAWRHRFIPDTWAWELPGGVVEDGETPAQAAVREAEEETGWRPAEVQHLITYEPMPGIAATPHHVFYGADPVLVSGGELAECVRSKWIPISEIPQLLAKGEVSDSAAMIGLQQLYLATLDKTLGSQAFPVPD